MLGFVLDALVTLFVARAIWKLIQGFKEGYSGPARSPGGNPHVPSAPSVHMSRDPVCGTFVIPDHALAISEGSRRIFFCSAACRDKYRAKSA